MKPNLNTDKPKIRKEPNAVFFGHFMNPAEESYKGADLNAQIMHRIEGK